ncbi:MAG: SDR family NAD(P)-dependent oxidoreductase [Proteobacteria bacterium]|jgi:short-subunit dehydrogenase|nr:SDR family NAD(P)-dependent oxidoreductase [Pseudomonadota bacterium]
MKSWAGKRYWLIGASEGLGRSLATLLSFHGVELILSSRDEGRLIELCASLPSKASYYVMDVSDKDEVRRVTQKVGSLDGVVYLAGVYWPMRSENWDSSKVEKMCDTNFVGATRVLGYLLPEMIKAQKGHIVLTGSLAGYRGLPGAIGYGASKAALMHLAESIYSDLRRTNIKVQLINPGFIKTRLTDKNNFRMPFILTAEDAAKKFFKCMNARTFKTDFPWGFGLMFRLTQFLPQWLYYRLFS